MPGKALARGQVVGEGVANNTGVRGKEPLRSGSAVADEVIGEDGIRVTEVEVPGVSRVDANVLVVVDGVQVSLEDIHVAHPVVVAGSQACVVVGERRGSRGECGGQGADHSGPIYSVIEEVVPVVDEGVVPVLELRVSGKVDIICSLAAELGVLDVLGVA